MTHSGNPLPTTVVSAIERGELIEAIKLLRSATGLGLKESKDAIDAHLSGKPLAILSAASLAAHELPPAVMDALRRGSKIEAIKLLHTHGGLGLKEAKERIDQLADSGGSDARPHNPGMVVMPRSSGLPVGLLILGIAGLIGYYLLRSQS